MFMTTACGMNTGSSTSISDIEGSIVYMEEDGKLTPFIVADKNYRKGVTLLVREHVLPEPMRFNEYESYYEGSEIDRYLSNEYADKLGNKEYLVSVPIDITAESSIGLTGKDTTKISRCVFLLSYTELGYKESPTTTNEGATVSYFRKMENRLATDEDGNTVGCLMRSPNTYHGSMVYVLSDDGTIGGCNAFDENDIRPAVCVRDDMPVMKYGSSGSRKYIFVDGQ
jgi:hypothetical protein